jgi:hypothetical protein
VLVANLLRMHVIVVDICCFRCFNIVVSRAYLYQANITYGDRIGARVMAHDLMAHAVK